MNFKAVSCVLVLTALVACGGGGGGSTPTTTAPTISSFTAPSATVNAGDQATLSWAVTGGTPASVKLTGTGVDTTGAPFSVTIPTSSTSYSFDPANRQTYTLTVSNAGGQDTKTFSVAAKGINLYSNYLGWSNNAVFIVQDSTGRTLVAAADNTDTTIDSVSPTGVRSIFSNNTNECDGLAISPLDGTIYVAMGGSIYTMNSSTGAKTLWLTGTDYSEMAVANDGTIYSCGLATQQVYKITTQKVVTSLANGLVPVIGGPVVSSDGATVYVCGAAASTLDIYKIDTSTGTLISSTPVADSSNAWPSGMVIDPTGTYMYLGDGGVAGNILKVNLNTQAVTTVATVPYYPLGTYNTNPTQIQIPRGFCWTTSGDLLVLAAPDGTQIGNATSRLYQVTM